MDANLNRQYLIQQFTKRKKLCLQNVLQWTVYTDVCNFRKPLQLHERFPSLCYNKHNLLSQDITHVVAVHS